MRGILITAFLAVHIISYTQINEGAILTLSSNSFDFGRIFEDKGIVHHRFYFTNSGTEPLTITNVRTTCGCAIPVWTKNPVLPGNEGFVEIEFNPKNRPGAFHKTVQIQSTAHNANMFVTISGTVIPPLKMENLTHALGVLKIQTNVINLGYLYKGATGVKSLIIANPASYSVEVGFANLPDHLALLVDPQVLQPGEYGQIEVQYCTEKLDDWDVVIDQIPVVLNNKEDENIKLTITANIREDFSVLTQEQMEMAPIASYSKDTYIYDTITRDDPIDCRFLIRNDGQSELIIRAVKPSCGCTAVKPEKSTLAPGDSTYIDAMFYPKGRSGNFKNGITVVTNDPKLYKKYLFIEGYIKSQDIY